MADKTPYAIVLGLYGENGVGVVRSLGMENIPVAGFHLNFKYPHAYHSRYLQHKEAAPDKESLLERVVNFGQQQQQKGVIFCTDDELVMLVQDNAELLKPYFVLPLSEYGNLNNLTNKCGMLKLGEAAGFKVPASAVLSSEEVFGLDFPVIVKPSYSIGYSKSDFKIIPSREELYTLREGLLKKCGEMEVESYIPGPVGNQIEIHAYLTSSGKVIFGGMLRYIISSQEKRLDTLMASVDESIWIKELVEPAEKLAQLLRFKGALDINLKINDTNHEPFFYEVNLRTSANLMLDTSFGLNLPAIIYYDHTGQDYSRLMERKHLIGKYWISDRRAGSSLANEHTTPNTLSQFIREGVHSIYDPQDYLPFYISSITGNLPLIIKGVNVGR
jgi:predicted ATP-grasp superfamily ATP-dependent carboligase